MAKISSKNSKLGNIQNISLPPIMTCRNNAPCASKCYALKSYRMYKNVKSVWDSNLAEYFEDSEYFENDILRQIPFYGVFRWHVSGDIIDLDYFEMMVRIAKERPNVKFLAFTKQYEIVNEYDGIITSNLNIVFSGWVGLNFDNPKNLPVAWYQDGTETRVPSDSKECTGKCDSCGICWSLKSGESVVFNAH